MRITTSTIKTDDDREDFETFYEGAHAFVVDEFERSWAAWFDEQGDLQATRHPCEGDSADAIGRGVTVNFYDLPLPLTVVEVSL